jgi:hypothetical protein
MIIYCNRLSAALEAERQCNMNNVTHTNTNLFSEYVYVFINLSFYKYIYTNNKIYLSIFRLSAALEAERQSNMNNIISTMMTNVKEKKLDHMKKLKKLNNEKTILGKKFKENRENNSNMKLLLDEKMKKYEILQSKFDDASDEDRVEMEQNMSDLLYAIGMYLCTCIFMNICICVFMCIYVYIYMYM